MSLYQKFNRDKFWHATPGATIIRIGRFAIDAGKYGLHMHLFSKFHIWLIPEIVGMIELFKDR